jgi:sodium transport system permease protein
MTAAVVHAIDERAPAAQWIRWAVVVVASALLLARPAIAATLGWSVPVVAGFFALVLALGLAAPLGTVEQTLPANPRAPLIALVAGAAIFGIGRIIEAGHPPVHASVPVIALNTLAAIGEEAVFRKVAYDALSAAGPLVAIGASALVFGVAHVTVYGWWVLPLDTAAGIVFGWQRWASGTWLVPAGSHALADLLVVM